MKTNPSVNFWAEGELRLKLYVSANEEHPSIALEIMDNNDTIQCPAFFVDLKYREKLTAAIVAFNSAWEQTNGTANK